MEWHSLPFTVAVSSKELFAPKGQVEMAAVVSLPVGLVLPGWTPASREHLGQRVFSLGLPKQLAVAQQKGL